MNYRYLTRASDLTQGTTRKPLAEAKLTG